jgi:hypothetical protein
VVVNRRSLPEVVRGVGALLLVVVLLGGAACGVTEAVGAAEPCDPAAPVAPWLLRLPGEGEPVFGGVSVPSGAVLAGRAFPDTRGGEEALLMVTGCDPLGAFRDLVARIERAGYDVGSTRADGHLCTMEAGTSGLRIDRTPPAGARLQNTRCEANGVRPADDGKSLPLHSVGARLFIPGTPRDGRPAVIELRSRATEHGPPATTDVVIPVPARPLRLAQPAKSVPDAGDEADRFVVLAGSHAIAPTLDPMYSMHFSQCSNDGAVILLEVTGAPEAIHRQYVRQGLEVYQDRREDLTVRAGTVEVLRFSVRGRGSALYIETFIDQGSPTFTRIERCVD